MELIANSYRINDDSDMKELETLFIVIGLVTGVILLAYWKMSRKARPKKSEGWSEPRVK